MGDSYSDPRNNAYYDAREGLKIYRGIHQQNAIHYWQNPAVPRSMRLTSGGLVILAGVFITPFALYRLFDMQEREHKKNKKEYKIKHNIIDPLDEWREHGSGYQPQPALWTDPKMIEKWLPKTPIDVQKKFAGRLPLDSKERVARENRVVFPTATPDDANVKWRQDLQRFRERMGGSLNGREIPFRSRGGGDVLEPPYRLENPRNEPLLQAELRKSAKNAQQ